MIVKAILGLVLISGSLLIAMVICNFIGYGIRLIVEKNDHLSPSIHEWHMNCIYGFFGSMIILGLTIIGVTIFVAGTELV